MAMSQNSAQMKALKTPERNWVEQTRSFPAASLSVYTRGCEFQQNLPQLVKQTVQVNSFNKRFLSVSHQLFGRHNSL